MRRISWNQHARLEITEDGWLNRASKPCRKKMLRRSAPCDGAESSAHLARQCASHCAAGPEAIQGNGTSAGTAKWSKRFEAMYAQTVDRALHGTGTETFEAIIFCASDPAKYQRKTARNIQ